MNNLYNLDNDNDNVFPTALMREARKAYKAERTERACKQALDSGLKASLKDGSVYITMPDKVVVVFHPQARKWRVKGTAVYYGAASVKTMIKNYLKNKELNKKSSSEESIEKIQLIMLNSVSSKYNFNDGEYQLQELN